MSFKKKSSRKTYPTKSLWPPWCRDNVLDGFSDRALEKMAQPRLSGWESRANLVPTLFWTTEVYSLGKCYREWIRWPYWLPIPIYGDHGVCLKGELAPHEIDNKSKYHATWFKDRAHRNETSSLKKVIRIPHPWVIYRKKNKIEQSENAYGLVVFFVHSTSNIEVISSLEDYVAELENLPAKYKPLVFCVHMHDINKGIHKKIKNLGYPVITIGNTSSPYFVDRFYDVVRRFAHATSNVGGSELFYCYEMGIDYFLYGQKPVYYNISDANLPEGVLETTDEIERKSVCKKEELFRWGGSASDDERIRFVSDVLSLDLNPFIAGKLLKNIFLKETFRLVPVYLCGLIKWGLVWASKKG